MTKWKEPGSLPAPAHPPCTTISERNKHLSDLSHSVLGPLCHTSVTRSPFIQVGLLCHPLRGSPDCGKKQSCQGGVSRADTTGPVRRHEGQSAAQLKEELSPGLS